MKADERLTRKTHMSLPRDLTAAAGDDDGLCALVPLSQIEPPRFPDAESVSTLPLAFVQGQDILSWMAALAADSPTASRLWIEAERAGWKLGLASLPQAAYHLDARARCLVLDDFSLNAAALGRSPYFRNALMLTLVRALRDIWHESRSGPFEPVYHPETVLLLERVRAADCDTVAILCGWELRGAGYGEFWRHLIGAEEGDMALLFARHLERDPAAYFDGTALAHTFRQWFGDPARVDGCDHITLETMDELQAQSDHHQVFGAQRGALRAIERLACLPDGRSYLSGLGAAVQNDPLFAGMNDPVNQTHLLHLIHDLEAVVVNQVPFRDPSLALRIFPVEEAEESL